jgi:hypothetical protein
VIARGRAAWGQPSTPPIHHRADSQQVAYRAVLWLRAATRVLQLVAAAPLDPFAAAGDTVYDATYTLLDWPTLLGPGQTLDVTAQVRGGRVLLQAASRGFCASGLLRMRRGRSAVWWLRCLPSSPAPRPPPSAAGLELQQRDQLAAGGAPRARRGLRRRARHAVGPAPRRGAQSGLLAAAACQPAAKKVLRTRQLQLAARSPSRVSSAAAAAPPRPPEPKPSRHAPTNPRHRRGVRPGPPEGQADLPLHAALLYDTLYLYRDLSGGSLHRRGGSPGARPPACDGTQGVYVARTHPGARCTRHLLLGRPPLPLAAS